MHPGLLLPVVLVIHELTSDLVSGHSGPESGNIVRHRKSQHEHEKKGIFTQTTRQHVLARRDHNARESDISTFQHPIHLPVQPIYLPVQ